VGDRSVDRRAAQLRAEADNLIARAERKQAEAAQWESGAAGEDRLGELLAPLTWAGHVLLTDLGIPKRSSNIDAVVIGPSGVWVIDAKNWSGRVDVTRGELRQNGWPRRREVDGIGRQMQTVRSALVESGFPDGSFPIGALLCLTGQATVLQPHNVNGVTVIGASGLVSFLVESPPICDEGWVSSAAGWISYQLRPRTDPQVTGHDPGTSVPPEEPVIFLVPWVRQRHSRLYVKDEEFEEAGYLDLANGELVMEPDVPDPSVAQQVLSQLLPHYVDKEPDAATRGVIAMVMERWGRRSGPAALPLVVGRLWPARSTPTRMYVHRLGSDGGAQEIGWYSLEDQRVHADHVGAEQEIRWCGERYESLEAARRSG